MADGSTGHVGLAKTEQQLSRPLDGLIDLFSDHKDDETGEMTAVRGFSFQIWQSVVEALNAHDAKGDYAVVNEWKEDIAVLNCSQTPTRVKFIQTKKSEAKGNSDWTLSNLHSAAAAPARARRALQEAFCEESFEGGQARQAQEDDPAPIHPVQAL